MKTHDSRITEWTISSINKYCHFGAILGPFRGHSRANMKLCLTYTWYGEAKMGPFWGHSRAIPGPFSGHSETLPYLHLVWRSKNGAILGPFSGHSGAILGPFSGHSGAIHQYRSLGMAKFKYIVAKLKWGHSGAISGPFSGHLLWSMKKFPDHNSYEANFLLIHLIYGWHPFFQNGPRMAPEWPENGPKSVGRFPYEALFSEQQNCHQHSF